MKNAILFLLFFLIFFSSCKIAAGIFKAGFWSGLILVAVVIFAIIYFIAKGRGGKS